MVLSSPGRQGGLRSKTSKWEEEVRGRGGEEELGCKKMSKVRSGAGLFVIRVGKTL